MDKVESSNAFKLSGNLKAIIFMIIGCSSFSISDILLKMLTASISPVALAFWVDIAALAIILLLAKQMGGLRATLQSRNKTPHLLRGLCLTCGYILFLLSLPHMPVANSYTLTFLWPLIATFMAIFILKEKAYHYHWICLLLGLTGIIIILKPGFGDYSPHLLFPFGAAIFFASAMIASRKIPQTETHLSFAFYPIIVTLAVSGTYTAFRFEMPGDWMTALIICFSGLLNVSGCVFVGRAFSCGKTAAVSPFEYVKMFWAVVLGYLVFGDVLDPLTAMGATLIIASGIYLMLHEKHSSKRIAVGE